MKTTTLTKVLSAFLLVCLAAGLVGFSLVRTAVTGDPEKIARIAAKIADFRLPPGYHLQYGVKAFGYILVAAAPLEGSGHVFLAQAPDGSKLERMFGSGQVSFIPEKRDDRHPRDMVIIGTQEAVLRSQTVTLSLSEGINGSGEVYRQLTGLFEGRGGPALVSVSTPVTIWDDSAFADFLASIR